MIKTINKAFPLILILLFSFMFVSDLFLRKGIPATFDAPMHIAMIAGFYNGLKSGDFPVTWADGFANYGMPMPIIHQQLPIYLGAFINYLTNDVVVSYKIVVFIGVFLSLLFFYFFLRLYFSNLPALSGTLLFNFAPYRIFNVYIRGALPEFFASVFVPLILIALYLSIKKKNILGLFLLIFSVAGLFLSHPFVLLISAFIVMPYFIYLTYGEKNKLKKILFSIAACFIGLLLSAYYYLPLSLEIKYFYYGLTNNHLMSDQFLNLSNFFSNSWFYFYKAGEFNRGNFIIVGIFEVMIFIIGSIFLFLNKKIRKKEFLYWVIIAGLIMLFLTTSLSNFIYQKINILSSIQHPWRILSGFIFIPPIILAFFIENFKKHSLSFFFILMIIIGFLRFPQLYVKNNASYKQSDYFFTTENLAATVLNTIWTGVTRDYPIKKNKIEIISGQGKLLSENVSNSYRNYSILASTQLTVVDYTFYFPGWHVYIDGKNSPIEFQNPNFRGVITYQVPPGQHQVKLTFQDTKVRRFGKIISLVTFIALTIFFFLTYNKRRIVHFS